MKKPKILILGHKRHGKDTMAEILRDNFDFSFQSSSMAAAEIFLFDMLNGPLWDMNYNTIGECFEDRINHRPLWYHLISAYNSVDKMRLAREILSNNNCYVGMRNHAELEAAKGLFDLIIWVDAGERLPLESSSSMTGVISQADIVIQNNGTLEEFTEKVIKLGGLLYNKKID